MFEVRNELKFPSKIKEGDLIVQWDKVYRVLSIYYSESSSRYTVDLEGDGDRYEHWDYNQQINTVTVYADLTRLLERQ